MSFTITYNGLIIGTGTQYPTNQIKGFYGLPIRQSEANLVGRDGGNIFVQKYGMRNITLQGTLWGGTESDYFAKISSLIGAFKKDNTAKEMTILRWDGVTTSIFCKVVTEPSMIEKSGESHFSKFLIELKAEDPFFVDDTETIATTAPITSSGFPIPAVIPMPVGAVSGGAITIDNTGDVRAYASMKIDGGITNPTVNNVANSQQFTIATTIANGDYVTVEYDTNGLQVLLNGTINYMEYFEGTFPIMEIGTNTIKFSGSTSDSSALLTTTWRNKYLSLAT